MPTNPFHYNTNAWLKQLHSLHPDVIVEENDPPLSKSLAEIRVVLGSKTYLIAGRPFEEPLDLLEFRGLREMPVIARRLQPDAMTTELKNRICPDRDEDFRPMGVPDFDVVRDLWLAEKVPPADPRWRLLQMARAQNAVMVDLAESVYPQRVALQTHRPLYWRPGDSGKMARTDDEVEQVMATVTQLTQPGRFGKALRRLLYLLGATLVIKVSTSGPEPMASHLAAAAAAPVIKVQGSPHVAALPPSVPQAGSPAYFRYSGGVVTSGALTLLSPDDMDFLRALSTQPLLVDLDGPHARRLALLEAMRFIELGLPIPAARQRTARLTPRGQAVVDASPAH